MLEAAGLEVGREEDRLRGRRVIGVVEQWLILVLATSWLIAITVAVLATRR